MNTYKVDWSKAYYVSGCKEVEAESPEQAITIVDNIIGNLHGRMQYNPDDNDIDVVGHYHE